MPKNFSAWPEGYPQTLAYPILPVFEILNQTAQRIPNHQALIFNRLELSFKDLRNFADRFAAALAGLGVVKGDRVALHLPNCPQFAIAYYGLLKAGAVFTPVSPLLTVEEVRLQLLDCGAKVLVTLERSYPSLQPIIGHTDVQEVIITNLEDCSPDPVSSLGKADEALSARPRDFISLLGRHSADAPHIDIDPKRDLAHLSYTGGTTGRSKAVMLTHFNVLTNAVQIACWFAGTDLEVANGRMQMVYPEGVDPARDRDLHLGEEVTLVVNPWFHAMGVMGNLTGVLFLRGCFWPSCLQRYFWSSTWRSITSVWICGPVFRNLSILSSASA